MSVWKLVNLLEEEGGLQRVSTLGCPEDEVNQGAILRNFCFWGFFIGT
ncbi:MAG: hypothetical protein AB1638_01280 [Nitrospirota bacterium]